jgi:predicted phage terminase large subunit-like protein
MNDQEQAAKLLGSLLLFTKVFYKLRTGREFTLSEPIGRESHYKTISRALTKTGRGEINRLIINCPPRYGKTELCIHYAAWMMARYPDSNFMYISYSSSLAKRQTQTIRQIISHPEYKRLFHVTLSKESTAKDNFSTNFGGTVYAAGASGTVTGMGAGIKGLERFGGAILIDDIHKPAEVTSDTMRGAIKDWYLNTLQSRINNPRAPIVFIGQRLHEDDLPSNLIEGYDGNDWEQLVIPALDGAKNALHPEMHSKEQLLKMQLTMPYDFASQYQQNPQPAGGGIFKPEWIKQLPDDPDMLCSFITVDTAETAKTHNDPTVFSFWGIYKIINEGVPTDLYGIHSINSHQIWVEPKDLRPEFLAFYAQCMQFKTHPYLAAIEKKSTGTTLISILKEMQGLQILEIERHTNKTTRFLAIQSYLASRRVSIHQNAGHKAMFLDHIRKITANDTHRYDDIADTLADAVNLALIDKLILIRDNDVNPSDNVVATMARAYENRLRMGPSRWQTE